MEAKSEKMTFWQKLGYGVGDFYGGGAGTLISFFYLVFLTDVVRISPQAEHCGDVVRAFRAALDGDWSPQEAMQATRAWMPEAPCNGYWHGQAGLDWVPTAAPASVH
jgi:hypothetical protein